MLKPCLADTARAAEAWAEVRAHHQVMRYRRSGVGRAALLLRSPDHAEPFWPELLDALSTGFRLIIPEAPEADTDIVGWLADFLEGLGMWNVRMLAAGHFCVPALELALLDADQIARLVLVADGAGGRRVARGSGRLQTALRQVAVPLLVVRRDRPAEEIVPLVTDFLGDGTAALA